MPSQNEVQEKCLVNRLGSRGRAAALESSSVKLDAEGLEQSQPNTTE